MKQNNELFYALNFPKYYKAITNKGKATGESTKILKRLTISDIKKWKKGSVHKLQIFSFVKNKWIKFSFKFEEMKKTKNRLVEIFGNSKFYYDNPLFLDKENNIRGLNNSDESEIYLN